MKGILLVDKPQDWTSSDVVAKLRGVLHEKRIGHGGTLDPLATGLLVLMIGRATRASDDIMGHDKTYHALFRPGVTTDTQDITGTVLHEVPESLTREDVARGAERFLGEIQQIPPMYSAIKVGGKKLYEIARRGGEVERKARPVTVYRMDVGEREGRDFPLEVRCSAGTYIRTLCHDLGEAIGCGGCMAGLRRTEVGHYALAEAHPLKELLTRTPDEIEAMLLPVDSVYAQVPAFTASSEETEKLLHGNPVSGSLADGLWRVYSPNGEFLLLGEAKQGLLKIEKSFFEPLAETCGTNSRAGRRNDPRR